MQSTIPISLAPTEQIAARLRGEVVAGRFHAGEPLREVALATEFGVGRTLVRQAFGVLVKEGLLTAKRNCGVTVAEPPSPAARELLTPLRVEIESYALRRCFDGLNDAAFHEWDTLLIRLRHAAELHDRAAILDADNAFHRSILVRAGLEELVPVWQPIITRLRGYHDLVNQRFPDAQLLRIHAIHKELVRVFREGTLKQAQAALRSHIEDGAFNWSVEAKFKPAAERPATRK